MLKIGDQYKKRHSIDTALQWYDKSYIASSKEINKFEILTIYAATALSSSGLVEYSFNGNYKKSLDYSNKSIQICNTLLKSSTDKENQKKIKKILYSNFNNIGIIYGDQGDYKKAVEYYLKSLKIIEEMGDRKGMAACYTNIGNVHFNQDNTAIEYYIKSLGIKNQLGDKDGIAFCYNNIGAVYTAQGIYDKAIKYYLKSLKIDEELKDTKRMSACYTNIGNIHYSQGSYDKANTYFLSSLKIKIEIGDKKGMYMCYNNIGNVQMKKGNYDIASQYYQKSLLLAEEIEDKKGMYTCYSNLGIIQKELGDTASDFEARCAKYTKAIDYYQKSLAIAEETGDKNGIVTTYINISSLDCALASVLNASHGGVRLQKLVDAKENGIKAFELACEMKTMPLVNKTAAMLMEVCSELGDYEKAYMYAEIYIATRDSMFKEEKIRAISNAEEEYQADKKQKEISVLKKEQEINVLKISQTRIILIAIIGIFVLVLFVIALLIRQYRLRVYQSSTELKQKLLRTQMNPHFIFNSLIAIQSFMYKNEPEDACKYLSGFAKLTRLILENSNYEYVSLEKEVATLSHYMELQALRFEDRFDYYIEIDPEINTELVEIPPMLAQPFIENAIEHGMKNITEKGKIGIRFLLKDEFILFSVEDNGSGIILDNKNPKEQTSSEGPHAISITQERLSNLNRKSKQKIELMIDNISNQSGQISGTKVSFYIPFRTVL
jgi:tetratricopeptide (TPR) repeat protein